MDDAHQKLREFGERLSPIHTRVTEIAGFDLPAEVKRKFLAIYSSLRARPRPPWLARLTVEEGARRDWYTPLVESILGDVQEGVACCHYHLSRVEEIENQLIALVGSLPEVCDILSNVGTAGGNTRVLDFEYQAFVFALRRTLEYFANSVGSFFKKQMRSFKNLRGDLANAMPEDFRERVGKSLDRARGDLIKSGLLSQGEEKSVRDRLAHRKTVGAGAFHVNYAPDRISVGVFGGGEDLRPGTAAFAATLTPNLCVQLQLAQNLIFGCYRDLRLLS